MKIVGRVVSSAGPVVRARVEIVEMRDGRLLTIGEGTVLEGKITAAADAGPVWSLRIDDRAVVAVPVSFDGDVVDLGELVLVPNGVPWPLFHAKDGRVYFLPRTIHTSDGAPVSTEPVPQPVILKSRMTFGDVFGSTARQLATAVEVASTDFAISGATVTLKGVPTTTDDAISLEFPTTEVAASGVGLSELSFSIRPKGDTRTATETAPAGRAAPDLMGYTGDFAARKAAKAGFLTEISYEIVGDAARDGSVLRQVPAAGATLATGGLIRLYVGKKGA